jgi:hypothetical protein
MQLKKMKGLPESPPEYFNKFDTTPVSIRPFNPRSKVIADEYLDKLRYLFEGLNTELAHRGSTAFGIAGKGDIELGVYPSTQVWGEVLERLKVFYGLPGNVEENYVRFNDTIDGYEIEIIVLREHEAEVDKRLTKYLMENTDLLKEYEDVKMRFAFSKKEYQKAKDRFLRTVVEMIPEEQRIS